jgi:hypothetical protein
MVQPRYRSGGTSHSIDSVSRSGDRVLLEDGSVWALDPADLPRVRRWSQGAAVEVREAGDSDHLLVARCNGREERVLVGFRGFLSDNSVEMALAS